MNRASFLGLLAAVPLVGPLLVKPARLSASAVKIRQLGMTNSVQFVTTERFAEECERLGIIKSARDFMHHYAKLVEPRDEA
jgi:hypothetical protein